MAKTDEKPWKGKEIKALTMLLAFVKDPQVVLLHRGDVDAHLLLAAQASDQEQRQCPVASSRDGGACGRHKHQRGRNCRRYGISRCLADSMTAGDKGGGGAVTRERENARVEEGAVTA